MTDKLNLNIFLLPAEFFLFVLVVILFLGIFWCRKKPELEKSFLNLLPVYTGIVFLVSISGLFLEVVISPDVYILDGLSQFFKVIICGGFFVLILNSRKQKTLDNDKKLDYYLFLTLSTWGLVILSSATELLTIFLAMELASFSLYVLIPLRAKSKEAAEAGVKYILFGAAATAISLFGFSWILASQGTTILSQLMLADWSYATNPIAVIGLAAFLMGMFYKLALFPFHFWCPDVYQGASNETAAYVATLPKLGAIIILIRLGALISPDLTVTKFIAILAACSMTFGNLCALVQKDLKRMLGFSSVSHAGYLMVALIPGNAFGLGAAAFYALAYVLMNLLCFWIISRISQDGRNLTYNDLNGLSKRSPIMALALAAAAFSLVGLPPTVGFIAKFWVLTAAWGYGYNWLVILLCVNSAIAIYYYLSLVRHAYTEDFDETKSLSLDNSFFAKAGALVLAILVVLLGVLPNTVFDWVVKASTSLTLMF